MRLQVYQKSNLLPSWTQLVLTSFCPVLQPCHSSKGCDLLPSFLLWSGCERQEQEEGTHTHERFLSTHYAYMGEVASVMSPAIFEMVTFSSEAQSVSTGSPNRGKVQHNCATVQSELFQSSHWVGLRMTCLNLESLFWGATEGGARREVGPFLFLLYREN